MNQELQDIINQSSYAVIGHHYIYVKARSFPKSGEHFLVTKDADEITVVTTEDELHAVDVLERNKETYSLIALHVSIPFYCVGFLAAVTEEIARQGKNILIVSTYSKDYILVKVEDSEEACSALEKLGFKNLKTSNQ